MGNVIQVIAAPLSTKALILTDGSITSVEGFNLSFLLNTTLLNLSTNGIIKISDDAFLGLRTLKILLLDWNQISNFSITYSTFHELQKLQVLVLSNNILSTIHGNWFKNTKALIRLHLNGNQLTSISANSFEMANLGNLRILDLSNNFINSIERKAFDGLPQLMKIDLSRNRLALIPDIFSPLNQLTVLNLDWNWWNCTCKLYDLAFFLRKYVNSSSKTLSNPENMTCKSSENPSVTNLLELTEVNCRSTLKRPPSILKTERKNYGRDIALAVAFSFIVMDQIFPAHTQLTSSFVNAVHHRKNPNWGSICSPPPSKLWITSTHGGPSCYTGGVGLACLVLDFFNRELQPSKANEQPSENCCCRIVDESQCGHEPRNYLSKGYCNYHLTQENEIKVKSVFGSGREISQLQDNSHQETVKSFCKCTGLKMPFGSIQTENEPMRNNHFLCLNCSRLQSYPQESSGNTALPIKTELTLQKHFQRTQRSEDSLAAESDDPHFNQAGTRSDTLCGRYSKPLHILAEEKLGEHLPNELCQSLSLTEYNDCFKSYKQRHLITALSSARDTLAEPKEHYVRAALESHRSQWNDQCGLLASSKNMSPQLDNFLICKYTDSDQNQDSPKVKEHNVRVEKEKSGVKSRRSKGCYGNDKAVSLSPAVKKTYKPKHVSFYVPDLATIKKADGTINNLNEKRFPLNKQWHEHIQGNQSPVWTRRLLNDSEAKKRFIQKQKTKMKRLDLLTVKLNLHPFQNTKIHPKELLHRKSIEQRSCCQHTKLLHSSNKKEKRKKSSESSVVTQEMLESNKDSIYKRTAVEKVPEENGNNAEISNSGCFKNIPALKITEAASSTKHLQSPVSLPIFSVNKTSGMTVPIIPLPSGHSSSILQDITNNILTSVSSKKPKSNASVPDDTFFHQNSLKTEARRKCHYLSPVSLTQTDNLDLQNPSNGDDMHCQQIVENVMLSTSAYHFRDQQLKEEKENLTRKDGLVGQEKVSSESNSLQGNLASLDSQNSVTISLSNGHQLISANDANGLKSPAHLRSTYPSSHALKEELQMADETNNGEEGESKIQQLTSDLQIESNHELMKTFIPNTPMDSTGQEEGGAQAGGNWDNNQPNAFQKNNVKLSIVSSTSSIPTSSENGNMHLNNNTDPQKNQNVHMDNDNDLQKIPGKQFDEGNREHKEGEMPPATHQEPPLLSELKDVGYEQGTDTVSLSCNTNKAEISVLLPLPCPTTTDFNDEFPLQVEQSKAIVSNNTYSPSVLFKDKKPFSV